MAWPVVSSGPPNNKNYRLSARLLARKGGAEPLQARGGGLLLSRDAETPEDELVAAVVNSTLDLLTARPKRGHAPKAPAALTDLIDPTLVDKRRTRRGN